MEFLENCLKYIYRNSPYFILHFNLSLETGVFPNLKFGDGDGPNLSVE